MGKRQSRHTSVRTGHTVSRGMCAQTALRPFEELISLSMKESRSLEKLIDGRTLSMFPLSVREVNALHKFLMSLGWVDREDFETYEIVMKLAREFDNWLTRVK
jgi:hypothetical protein